MTDSSFDDWDAPRLCGDCQEPLSGVAEDHSKQGFGHYGRCCACYEKRQQGPMNKYTPNTDEETIRIRYENNFVTNSDNAVYSTAVYTNHPPAPLSNKLSKGTRLRWGKVRGESKASRRLRRRAVVG